MGLLVRLLLLAVLAVAGAERSPAAEGASLAEVLTRAIEDYQFQEYDRARAGFDAVLRAEPANPYALHYLGRLELETGHFGRAADLLEQQIATGYRFEGDAEMLADACLKAGRIGKAERVISDLLRAHPGKSSLIFLRARLRERQQRLDEALGDYAGLFSDSAHADAAHFQAGGIYYRMQAYRAAREQFSAVRAGSAYGAAAKQYLEALAPLLRPISLNVSVQAFHNDNPGAASSKRASGAIPSVTVPSFGTMAIAGITSAALEAGLHARLQLGYTYLNIAHRNKDARSNDFAMHSLSGTASWIFSPSWRLDATGSWQYNLLDRKRLSNVYTASLAAAYANEDPAWQGRFGIGATLKRHNASFGTPPYVTDMTYLDADSPFAEVALSRFFANGGYLQGSYRFEIERTLRNINPVLDQKSRDSRYRQHNLSASGHLPMSGSWRRLSLDVSASYFYRSYQYPQSGISLPSIKPGRYLRAIGTSADVMLSVLLWERGQLAFTAGYHREQTLSDARELSYRQNKYYGQLSARF
ncbi:MAG: hypothetical protein R8K47_01125 [Mariprofundaceae bacterium]